MRCPSPRASSSLVLLVATGALLPSAAHQLGLAQSFLPTILGIVACFDLMSVYLLVGEFYDTGDRRILAMSWCYVWSLVMMAGYTLSFPGVVAVKPPLALTPSMAPWFYIAWHAGFPFLLGVTWIRWPLAWGAPAPTGRRRRQAHLSLAAVVAASTALVTGMAVFADHLPVLIHGLDTSRMTTLTAPVALPLTLVALVLALRGTKGRVGPERWTPVVVMVCFSDLVLTYAARHRYSVGWYAGRTLTMVSAGVVLAAMLATLRRAKSEAVHQAMVDSLTGLANRRSAERDLQLLIAYSQLTGTALSAISIDIDHFKAINDQYGHQVGDEVLVGLGHELPRWLRQTDVAARVGGEEFLVILPNTDLLGAARIAEKIRASAQDRFWPGVTGPVTLSLGVGRLSVADDSASFLRALDAALYDAKHGGRNQVALARAGAPQPRQRADVPVLADRRS